MEERSKEEHRELTRIGEPVKRLEEYRNSAWKCVKCRLCGMVNPELMTSETYVENCPRGHRYRYDAYYGAGTWELIRMLTTEPPEIDIDDERLKHIVFNCILCGNCQSICAVMKEMEPMNAVIALREHLVQNGVGPLAEHSPLVKSIENYDNPWMSPRTSRDKWAKKLGLKDISKEKAEVLMFVGCTGSYDPAFRSTATSTATVLKKLGIDFGILGKKEQCCSGIVFRIGERGAFETLKKNTAETINELECKTVVTACAGCYSTFHTEYSDDLNAEVLHSVEFLDRLIQEGELEFTKEVKKRVTYHDPCHVGRYAGIYEAPRNILKAIPGLELIEMERIRGYSRCCGAGAGVKSGNPDFAMWCAKERLEEARDVTGTDMLVTCCPFCEQNLRDASKGFDFGIEVVDLMDLVAMALE